MTTEAKLYRKDEAGFSLIEMMISMTITLILCGLAFSLLAATLRQKTRAARETSALSDATQSLSWMTGEIMNAGFGLSSNGIMSDSNEDMIHIRANLNTFMGETTSNVVTDQGEDVIYQLAVKPDGGVALIRSDVGLGTNSVVGTVVDNSDVDGDGEGDGLNFQYLDASGTATSPTNAARVVVSVRVVIPQVGVPGSDGYQPQRIKVVRAPIVLRNAQLAAY